MRFTSIVACLATIASAIAAEIAFTSYPTEPVQAGQTYTLQWSPSDKVKTVSIVLRWGDPNALNEGNVLASNLANTNSYQWSVPASLYTYDEGEKDTHYAFEIKYEIDGKEESNYTGTIKVEDGKDFTSADKTSSADDEDTTSTVTETTDMTTTMTTTALDSSTTDDEETTTTARRTTTRTTTTDEATETEVADAESTSDSPSGGSVARSSSLAMVFCILAAVFYLN